MSLKTNSIYCGDSKDVLRDFPDECVDLIYLDPPFFSNKNYEVIWKDGYEVRAFEDRWKGGIEHYIGWMEERIRQCHRVLKPTGSIYLHCDAHASHYLKVMMDRIFGYKNLRSEIIWNSGSVSGFKSQKKGWIRQHDTILYYAKSDNFTFNKHYELYKEEYIKKMFKYHDENGRTYRKRDNKKQYLDESKGMPIGDVWNIFSLQTITQSKEKLGYPTQKPEALLERIISASSNSLDVVLDPFCGCGTAVAVAEKLGRQWIGIDVSPTACRLMTDRLRKIGVDIGESDIIGLPRTIEELKAMDAFEFQNWVCHKIGGRANPKKTGDMGIDGWMFDGSPIQVKQSSNVGRNTVDNFETAIRRANKDKGIIIAFSFGKGAYEEAARATLHDDLEIELKTVEDLARSTTPQQVEGLANG